MNFQEQLSKIVAAQVQSDLASKDIITLGELIARLEPIEKERPGAFVQFDQPERVGGHDPRHLESYRGYYDQLALVPGDATITVRDLLAELRGAIGKVFEGYKGGDYMMTRSTFVWASAYGSASGIGVTGVLTSENGVVLTTAEIDS